MEYKRHDNMSFIAEKGIIMSFIPQPVDNLGVSVDK